MEKNSFSIQFLSILLLGVLSTTCAEVMSGSSPLWFISGWGLIMVLPLYLSHSLFLLNLAIVKKRTSIPQLYLLGCIFGLYEGPLTKVFWLGFPGSEGPLFGTIGGIAIFEFITLVFFWHPVFAFIIPTVLFEILSISVNDSTNIAYKSHEPFLRWNRKNKTIWILIFILSGGMLVMATGSDLVACILAILGSLFIILILFLIIKKKAEPLSIRSLKLSSKGMILLVAYLVLLYIFMIFTIIPEGMSILDFDFTAWLIIILTAIMLLFVFFKSEAVEEPEEWLLDEKISYVKTNHFFILIMISIISLLVWLILSEISVIILTVFTLLMPVVGLGLFILSLLKIFLKKKEKNLM